MSHHSISKLCPSWIKKKTLNVQCKQIQFSSPPNKIFITNKLVFESYIIAFCIPYYQVWCMTKCNNVSHNQWDYTIEVLWKTLIMYAQCLAQLVTIMCFNLSINIIFLFEMNLIFFQWLIIKWKKKIENIMVKREHLESLKTWDISN